MKMFPKRVDLIKLLPPGSVIAEVGVWRGYFSVEILNNCPNIAKLYAVDAWKRQVWSKFEQQSDAQHEKDLAECRHHLRGFGPRVEIIRGTSADVALNNKTIPPLDAVFIDAAHEYQFVMEDLINWSKRLKPNGVITGHDYVDPEKNTDAKRWGFGVIRAVNDFCDKYNWELTHLTDETFASYRIERGAWRGADL